MARCYDLLTVADRKEIERGWAAGDRISVIARKIGKNGSTVLRELRRGAIEGCLMQNGKTAYSADKGEAVMKANLRKRAVAAGIVNKARFAKMREEKEAAQCADTAKNQSFSRC